MTITDAKLWAADCFEVLAICNALPQECVDPVVAIRESRIVKVRASKHSGDGCLRVTDSAGQWAAYYKPSATGRLILAGISEGNPPGDINLLSEGPRILSHFAGDLAKHDPNAWSNKCRP